MLHIKAASDQLKRQMLQSSGARGDFIGHCCLLVSLLVCPYLLFQSIDIGHTISAWLVAAYMLVTLSVLTYYSLHPTPRLLSWYAPTAYSLFCIYSLLDGGTDQTGYLWSCLAPPLIMATLGIKLGGWFFAGFLVSCVSVLYAADLLGEWAAPYPESITPQLTITLLSLGLLAAIIEFATDYAFTNNQELTNRLRQQALKDDLTGLANRRAMRQTLFREIARSQRTGRPISLLMVDIDFFKKINDTFGHDVGDQALRWLAEVFLATLRVTDVASRWGGEEFLILLPETDLQQAFYVANRIRETVEEQNLPDCPQDVHFTVSCGIANSHTDSFDPVTDIDLLTNMADENLYKAKHNGRNRVEPQVSMTEIHHKPEVAAP